jgi:trimeric autotransporter adhesin
MRRTEQIVLAVLAVSGVIIGFWLVVLSPKRDEASKLSDKASALRSSLDGAQQEVAAGEKAQRSFDVDYRRLVVLGKAVPADDGQASLLVQLQRQATQAGAEFQSIDLSADSSSTAAPTTTPTDSTSTDSSSTDSSSTDSSSTDSSSTTTTTSSVSAAPTEAAASTLPIGASVGPAGLPVMAYDLTFTGQFFQIADFMQRVDGMVGMRDGTVDVRGRLLTVNGFTLEPSEQAKSLSDPVLDAHLNVTTYLTPADQGLTGGATPAGPSSSTLTSSSSSTETTQSTSTATPTDTATSTTP